MPYGPTVVEYKGTLNTSPPGRDASSSDHVDDANLAVRSRGRADDSAVDPESGVKRALSTRHLSMMALAVIIGPGLPVRAGGALANGGPASLTIGFGAVGLTA